MTRIAVVIPVGPEEHHAAFLDEALDSIALQTRLPDLLMVVDDMHGRGLEDRVVSWFASSEIATRIWRPVWRVGVGGAFNAGCAAAFRVFREGTFADGDGNDLALMMGADDKLEPRVLEHLARVFDDTDHAEGYYWLDTIYDSGEVQAMPCNNAAVTAGFMRETGGLPPEAGSGGMDAALISAMLTHRPEYLIHVRGVEGRVWNRQHEGQESRRLGRYFGAIDIIRNAYTEAWEPTKWGRYV